MRRIQAAAPVLVGVMLTLVFPPLGLVWAALLVRRRLTTGSWGVTLSFLSRGARRPFCWLAGVGIVVVCAADVSSLAGHGGGEVGPVVAGIVALTLLALVAVDTLFGASIVVAAAASRGRRRRR